MRFALTSDPSQLAVPGWHWGLLVGWFLFLILFDLLVVHRKDKALSFRAAVVQSIIGSHSTSG